MARQLRPGGILGVITSNRFLTTKGGMATRRFLRLNFEILELVDLGDTKLFEAAVLPALVFARKRSDTNGHHGRRDPDFIRIYEAGAVKAPAKNRQRPCSTACEQLGRVCTAPME